MPVTQSQTGRFGNATVAGVSVNITKWDADLHKALADATDSGNYDSATTQTYQSQAYGVIGIDGTLEGNYDLGGSTKTALTSHFTSDGPFAVVLNLTRTVGFASFNADFSNVKFSVAVPGSTMITWSASFKSNGTVTFL